MMRILLTGIAYVAAVFAAGFVLGVLRTLILVPLLGVLRTLILVPLLGVLTAVLMELPVILSIAWLVCTRILRRWPLSPPGCLGDGCHRLPAADGGRGRSVDAAGRPQPGGTPGAVRTVAAPGGTGRATGLCVVSLDTGAAFAQAVRLSERGNLLTNFAQAPFENRAVTVSVFQ
ncbi:MAG: hypothetical protein ACYC4S_10635 [Rhodoferax sp.]